MENTEESNKTENWLREIMGEIKLMANQNKQMSSDNSKKFDALNDRFDKKFDKLSSEIHEQLSLIHI